MNQDEFTRLFVRMNDRFDAIDERLENTATKDDIRDIYKHLDSIEKRLEVAEDERAVMSHQLSRLDRWTHEIAHKIDHKLIV